MSYLIAMFLRVLLKVFYIAPIDNNKIIYMAYGGNKYTCNPKYIYKYITEQQEDYKHIWVLNSKHNKELEKNPNTIIVKKNSFNYFYHFLTSKIVISNASIPTYIPLRKKQKYIETWHGGGAYKRTGIAFDQSKLKIKQLKLLAKEITLFISSSSIFTETKSKNHLVEQSKFYEVGMPRNDILFTESKEISNKVKDYYGINRATKIVLYAPTYRNKDDDSTTYEFLDIANLVKALKEKFGGDFVVFTRMHYYLSEQLQYKDAINVSSYDDMQELMLAADVLITDYSSVMWDFSFTKKPAFVFAPDLAEYEKNRSFFTPPEKWPYPVVQTNQILTEEILNFDQRRHETAILKHHEQQGNFEDGHATEKIYKKILLFREDK